jgi:hypothetical protein
VKRVIGFVAACAVASCIATCPDVGSARQDAPAKKAPVQTSEAAQYAARLAAMRLLAPADEYFGQLKMSILGIKNTIRDLGLRYDVNHDIARQTVASAALTEGAIRDWEHKYPRDREVPRAMYFLQRLYAHILDAQAQLKAKATAAWLFTDYPKSAQARELKKVIASATPLPAPVATSAAPLVAPSAPAAAPPPPILAPPPQSPAVSPAPAAT